MCWGRGRRSSAAVPESVRAAALVAQLADPDRGRDAVVIGEYERAFYGSQCASMAPLFEHYCVALWLFRSPVSPSAGRAAR